MKIFHEHKALNEGRIPLNCQQTTQSLRGSTSQIKAFPITVFSKQKKSTQLQNNDTRGIKGYGPVGSGKEIWSANNFLAKTVYSR